MQLPFLVPPTMSYAYIFPDVFLYGTMFIVIFEIGIAVIVMFPACRRFSVLLFFIGIFETIFSISKVFIEGFLVGLVTMFCGIFITGTLALKSWLKRKQVDKTKKEQPSPKSHWKGLAILITVVLFSGVIMFQYDLRTRPAYADYSIGNSVSRYYPNGNNSISISCNNWGDRDCSFYLVLRFENASISNQTQPPYAQVGSHAAKFLFSLQKSGSPMHAGSKVVYFTIDENVTGFSCYLSRENAGLTPVSGSAPISYMDFGWNETSQSYDMLTAGGFVV